MIGAGHNDKEGDSFKLCNSAVRHHMTKLVVEKESALANTAKVCTAAALQRLQLIITIRFVLKYGCLIGESRARQDKGLFSYLSTEM